MIKYNGNLSGLLQVRPASESDLPAIISFQVQMAQETEGLALELGTVTSGVQKMFSQTQWGQYWVAEVDNDGKKVVGNFLLLHEWSDWRNGKVLWIHSVYILPEFRRQGIYRKMYQKAQQLVEENPEQFKGLRLYVDKRNLAAQQAYKDLGMTNEHYDLYEWMN